MRVNTVWFQAKPDQRGWDKARHFAAVSTGPQLNRSNEGYQNIYLLREGTDPAALLHKQFFIQTTLRRRDHLNLLIRKKLRWMVLETPIATRRDDQKLKNIISDNRIDKSPLWRRFLTQLFQLYSDFNGVNWTIICTEDHYQYFYIFWSQSHVLYCTVLYCTVLLSCGGSLSTQIASLLKIWV